jgi:hypothetical protein
VMKGALVRKTRCARHNVECVLETFML